MHVGIIMDGNGRWASDRGYPRLVGHKRGANRVKEIVKVAPDYGVKTLTLYAFSTENWQRPAHEVEGLMRLFRGYLQSNAVEMNNNNMKVRFLGDPKPLSKQIRKHMDFVLNLTKNNTGLNFNIALNYGGRDELVRAAQKIAYLAKSGDLNPAEINDELFENMLDTSGQEHPDIIIRTAGEIRISNFMLWQAAYSEFIFLKECWPDFTPALFKATLESLKTRTRQFGAVTTR